MLNAAAVSLFKELPPELQDRFKDLPDLEEELCCRAEEIRDETGPGQQEELSRVIGALERVRLDLLRLRAGEGSPEEVRRALSAAAQVYQETGTRRASPPSRPQVPAPSRSPTIPEEPGQSRW
jgi:hypothetical protein